jgi:drug/metabolite transporter (DMT)-like permease
MSSLAKSPANAPLAGVLFALGGGVILSVNDLAIKALSGDYPLHQVMLIRAFIGIALVLAVIGVSGTGFRQLLTRRPKAHLLRVSLVMLANVTYFVGLAALPLADAVAIGFVAPLLITALSAILLGERVGPHRWAAVAVGLTGVMVMVRPGTGVVQPAALLVLASAFCYALTQMMTRRMRDTESAMTLNFFVQIGFVAVSLAMGLAAGDGRFAGSDDPALAFLLRAWVWPAPGDWWAFAATGVAVGAGGMMIAQAYRLSEAALVAPFEYIGMPMAIFWGAVVFGTVPDATGWLGIALICGAGLYTLARETLRRKDADGAARSGDL